MTRSAKDAVDEMQAEFTNNARPPTKLEKDRLDKIFEVAKHVFLDHEHEFERALGMGVIHGDIGPLYVVMIEEILPDSNSRGTHIQWDDLRV
jgi:hypothetical protein